MRKVTLIYDCLLSERNGANTVIRQLINNPELEKKGVFVKSLSPDDWGRVGVNHDTSSKRATIKKRIKTLLLWLTRYSSVVTALYLYYFSRVANRIAKEYVMSNPPLDEVAFFHTLYPCYYYLKHSSVFHLLLL